MKKYRLKFTLTDGRRIYATTGGKFDLVNADALESPSIRSLIDHGAYTQTLSMWLDPSLGSHPDYVQIASGELEPEGATVDRTAFILGGRNAHEDLDSMKLPKQRIGEHVRVRHVTFGYQLPEGLPEGATVKLLAFEPGWYTVEYEGQQLKIFMMCVDDGPTTGAGPAHERQRPTLR